MNPDFLGALIAFNFGLLLTLLLRASWRRLFGARAVYPLWLFAPLSAAASLLPSGGVELAPIRELVTSGRVEFPLVIAAPVVDRPALWCIAWLLGSGVIALAFLIAHWRLARQWRLAPRQADPRCPRLPIVRANFGPALVGLWQPVLVLPRDFEDRYERRQQALVFAHESAHAAAGDLRIRTLMLLLAIGQWWNPLGWFALGKLIEDQELACDAQVIAANPDERASYARTLTAAVLDSSIAPLMCSLHQSHPLLRRIAMLNRSTPSSRRRLCASLLTLLLALAMSAVVWAADAAAPTGVDSQSPSSYRVAVDLSVDAGPQRSYALVDRGGNRMQSTIDDGRDVIGIEVVVHETAIAGQVLLAMKLSRDGTTIGEPKLALMLNQGGRVEIGEDQSGVFTGMRLDIEVSRVQPKSARLAPFQRSATEAPVISGIGSLLQDPGDGC